ncbi:MAG: TetR/AcrR family transcriptional regulator, partial [Parvularculaceae bacterium]|nr:TetR/AcrR family transcriptional regulator [Parvularculaceae bacterium]
LRLLGRTLTEPSDFIRAFLASEYREVVERYKAALFKALPDVPKAEIVWRFHFMLGATSYAIAGTDALRLITDWQIEDADATDRLDRLLPRLMSFLLGGLRAPLPQFPDAE